MQNQLAETEENFGATAIALLGASMVVGLIAPRTFAFIAPVLGIIVIVTAFVKSIPIVNISNLWRMPLLIFAVFCLFAGISSIWSIAPLTTIGSVLRLAITVGFSVAAASVLGSRRVQFPHWAKDMLLATAVAVVVASAIDILSRMEIRLWVINLLKLEIPFLSPTMYRAESGRIAWVNPSIVNRSLVSLAVLIWPMLLVARAGRRKVLAGGLYIALILACFSTGSETAKLQLVVGSMTFCIFLYSEVWGRRVLVAGWIVSCALVVPLVVGMYNVGLHNSVWLPRYGEGASAAARIVIAHEYAERIAEAPLIGHAAAVSRELNQNKSESHMSQPHPHNAYLQLWFELGAVGVGLFMAMGFSVLGALKSLPPGTQPYSYALFASVATLLAPSYGFWQPWLSAMICYSIMFTAVAMAWNARE